MRKSRLDATALPQILFWGALFVLFHGPLFSPTNLMNNGDACALFLPGRALASRSFQTGDFPLWSPWQFIGHPYHASLQGGLLYPPVWIVAAAFSPDNMVLGMGLERLAHLLWMAIGLAWLARREYSATREASLFAALCLALSGWVVAHLGHVNQLETAAWSPWILGCARRLARRGKPLDALLLCGSLSMALLAGHPQNLYYTLILAALLMPAWMLSGDAKGAPSIARRLAWFGVAGALALGIAAAQLLPMAEAARHAWTIAEGKEYAASLALPVVGLLGYVAPWLFGSPMEGPSPNHPNWAFHEFAIYFSLAGFALALAGVVVALRTPRSAAESEGASRFESASLLFAWLLSGALALGEATPLFGFASEHLPLFGKLRAHARTLLIGHFAMLLFAARGFDALAAALSRVSTTSGLFTSPRSRLFLALAPVVCADLWFASRGAEFRHATPYQATLPRSPIVAAFRQDASTRVQGPSRAFWMIRDDHYFLQRDDAHLARAAQLNPNNNFADAVELVHGYGESLRPTLRWRETLYAFHRNFNSGEPTIDLLRLLNCSHVITDIEYPLEFQSGEPIARLPRGDLLPLALYRVPRPLPRVVSRREARELNRPGGLDMVALLESFDGGWRHLGRAQRGFDTRAVDMPAYLATYGPRPEDIATSAASTGRVIPLGAPEGNRQRFRVADGPAEHVYHVVSAYPGWRLRRLDDEGNPAEELPRPKAVSMAAWRADGPLSPGDYEFFYEPDSWRLGLAISAASLALLGCCAGFLLARRRRVRSAP
jgi:hypothetical protein